MFFGKFQFLKGKKLKMLLYMINLIFFGFLGLGKGIQVFKLVEKYSLLYIFIGDFFCYEMGNDILFGKEVKSYIEKGEFVLDSVMVGMLCNKVEANFDVAGYIFDGFFCIILQVEVLDELLSEKEDVVFFFIMLDVFDEELVKCLLEWGKIFGCKDDVDENIICNCIEVYKSEIILVFDYYVFKGKVVKVYGVGSIEEIFGCLCVEIDKL